MAADSDILSSQEASVAALCLVDPLEVTAVTTTASGNVIASLHSRECGVVEKRILVPANEVCRNRSVACRGSNFIAEIAKPSSARLGNRRKLSPQS